MIFFSHTLLHAFFSLTPARLPMGRGEEIVRGRGDGVKGGAPDPCSDIG